MKDSIKLIDILEYSVLVAVWPLIKIHELTLVIPFRAVRNAWVNLVVLPKIDRLRSYLFTIPQIRKVDISFTRYSYPNALHVSLFPGSLLNEKSSIYIPISNQDVLKITENSFSYCRCDDCRKKLVYMVINDNERIARYVEVYERYINETA